MLPASQGVPRPRAYRARRRVRSPVAITGQVGQDSQAAPVLVVFGVWLGPVAALVLDFQPGVLAGVDLGADGERLPRMA